MTGHLADLDALDKVVSDRGLAVLHDAAHAQGARWRGRRMGELGWPASFSFQNGKLMTAGEGGALLLPDQAQYESAFLRHSCGRPAGDRVYEHLTPGSNMRMNEFSAAVLRGQLSRVEEQLRVREARWDLLAKLLDALPGVVVQGRDPRCDLDPHYMAMFRVPGRGGAERNLLVDRLRDQGVPAFVAFPAVYRTEAFWKGPVPALTREELSERCPTAEAVASDCIWLHHRVLLASEEQIAAVVAAVDDVLRAG